MPSNVRPSILFTIASVLLSGACWYLGFNLSGNFWYVMWVAPIPVLYVSFYLTAWQAFTALFTAYLIGRLSWLGYLLSVIPATIAIAFTVLLPLVFALLAIAARKIMLKYAGWWTVFALPVFITSVEYLSFLFSRDGTIISTAYTQCNFLTVMQVASVTGIQGVTFLLTLVPTAIALMIYDYKQGRNIKALLYTSAAILCVVLAFGQLRLVDNPADKIAATDIGMASIDESVYKNSLEPDAAKEMAIANLYMQEVSTLANNGAQVIMLPEKGVIVNDSTYAPILQMFSDTARARNVHIIMGVAKIKNGYYENNAWVISNEGKLVTDYQKVNLFEGEVLDGFRPSKAIGLLQRTGATEAVAICKDMDFQQYLLQYSRAKPAVLYVPAWDFVRDGWLHCRMAMMRSIEGGYPMVRNAREGQLTINDYRGKILAEASSEGKAATELIGSLKPVYHATIYSRLGDWFSVINLVTLAGFVLVLVRRKGIEG